MSERIAIVGPNGNEKTTLGHALAEELNWFRELNGLCQSENRGICGNGRT